MRYLPPTKEEQRWNSVALIVNAIIVVLMLAAVATGIK